MWAFVACCRVNVLSASNIPMAGRSKAWDCGRSIGGTAGLNPTEGFDVRLLCVLCVVWVAFCATDR